LGKTTLLKLILERLQPTEGSVDKASRTEINYADQEKLEINDEDTIIKAVSDGLDTVKFGEKLLPTRTYLKKFLFDDKRMESLIKNLSGGERSRVLLAKILKNGGNFLILDEPTNDLDLSTLRVLEEALVAFEGVVVVVSHDRYFLNRVCTHILGFEGEGKTRFLGGDYDFYKKISREHAPQLNAAPQKAEGPIKPKQSFQDLKGLKRLEKQIEEAEKEVARREATFSDPDFYIKYGDKINELSDGLQKAKKLVDELYSRWSEML
jgi:ABC transport system ATP-binding/permease protein